LSPASNEGSEDDKESSEEEGDNDNYEPKWVKLDFSLSRCQRESTKI
jgi:hypothetical protein